MHQLGIGLLLADARQKQIAIDNMKTQKLVVVICNGNIHRSPIAEFCLNRALKEKCLDKKIMVVSRGIQGAFGGTPPSGKSLKDFPLEWSLSNPILEELGIDISNHCATPIEPSTVKEASLILAMDRKVLESLASKFPGYGNKIHLFRELSIWGRNKDVPDCCGSGKYLVHRSVIKLINNISKRNTETLLEWLLTLETDYRKGG